MQHKLDLTARQLRVGIPAALIVTAATIAGLGYRSPAPPAAAIPRPQPPLAAQPRAVAPEPLLFRPLAEDEAERINQAAPLSALPNPAARPFALPAMDDANQARSLECLTQAVYYEAASEGGDGQRAVAQVVLNRLRHPAFPKSVCGVVYQGSQRTTGCQFTFTCDGSLRRKPAEGAWRRARDVAAAALAGAVFEPVGYATHYHTRWVVPYWRASLVKLANIGAHIFYRWSGGAGTPQAFFGRHAGAEFEVEVAPVEQATVAVEPAVITEGPPARANRGNRKLIPVEAPLVAVAAETIAPKPIEEILPVETGGRRRPGSAGRAADTLIALEAGEV